MDFESASEAEAWAVICQEDWFLESIDAPVLIELRGPVVVMFWDAQCASRPGFDPEALFTEISREIGFAVHGLICHEGLCFEFYRAEGRELTLLDQPEEGDLGVASDFIGRGVRLDELDEQSAQSAILDAVAVANSEGAF